MQYFNHTGNAMMSHHCVYQLVLFVLLWLFVILHLTRPKPAVVASAAPALPEPLTPKRHRPHEPKPFEGLTHKPSCALCERDTAYPDVPPPVARPHAPDKPAASCSRYLHALLSACRL
jgi:hypothetical protein